MARRRRTSVVLETARQRLSDLKSINLKELDASRSVSGSG